ncbi:MAG: hypothetical protein IKR81_13030 [Victivallales bacterium]|nr:hypothetical protein [Victivallales bacterium]
MGDNVTTHTKCDRCGKDLQRGQIMSRFNTQVICLDCADKEEKAPRYATAKAAEQDAVLRGDYNFKGIGR